MTDEATGEKQHQASSKKIEDLRKDGQVLRSKDLSSALILAGSLLFLACTVHKVGIQFYKNFEFCFRQPQTLVDGELHLSIIRALAITNMRLMLPMLIFIVFIAVISPTFFGGWNFTLNSIGFKWNRLNFFSNLANMFSKQMLVNLLLSVFKVVIIFSCLFLIIHSETFQIFNLSNLPLNTAFASTSDLLRRYFILLTLAIFMVAGTDMFYHFYSFQQKNKMSMQEVKDEQKDTDGNIHTKRKIRSRQLALMKQRLSITVPKATVIITNPTHYSVAIAYDKGKDKAPRVVAKGKGQIAKQIRMIAATKAIPIFESPQLARAVYHTTKIGGEIHPALYVGVAIVLSYIMQLKHFQHGLGAEPVVASDLQIPKEFIFNE